MKHVKIKPRAGFHVIAGTEKSQAAVMTVTTGHLEGGPSNFHTGDQWLYVLSGKGKAVIEGKSVALSAGSLLLIEAGEKHQIEDVAEEPLQTLNIYAPPQY